MRIRTIIAACLTAATVAAPATAADDATAIEIAEHAAITGATTSIVAPAPIISVNVSRPVIVAQAVAKGMPSAYGTVTAVYSCSVAVVGDVSFITLTECSVTSNTGDSDNSPASGYINAAVTAANTNLTGRRISVCVNATVTPRVGTAFSIGRRCGISV